MKALRDAHMRLMTDEAVSPGFSLVYGGILTDYRRVRDHVLSIHEDMLEVEQAAQVG